jgi:hypothetical protein
MFFEKLTLKKSYPRSMLCSTILARSLDKVHSHSAYPSCTMFYFMFLWQVVHAAAKFSVCFYFGLSHFDPFPSHVSQLPFCQIDVFPTVISPVLQFRFPMSFCPIVISQFAIFRWENKVGRGETTLLSQWFLAPAKSLRFQPLLHMTQIRMFCGKRAL